MNLKRSVLIVIVLAVICIGQQVIAQETTPVNADQVFVPLPDDIDCTLGKVTITHTAVNDPVKGLVLVNSVDIVEVVTCHITGNSSARVKDIPLASTKVTDGMLRTKDFGDLKLSVNMGTSNGVPYFKSISKAIRPDKLQSFRAFLEKM
jgi:hypothetical protein